MMMANIAPMKVNHQGASGGTATPIKRAVSKALLSFSVAKTGLFLNFKMLASQNSATEVANIS